MVPEFEEAAFSLPLSPNQSGSDPIETILAGFIL